MRLKIKPFRARRMNRRMTLLLIDELRKAPVAPMKKLNEDARWFENEILKRRAEQNR